MGINRVSTYLPFTLGVLLRRAASTTLVYRPDRPDRPDAHAVTPRWSVRNPSRFFLHSLSFSFAPPASLFFFYRYQLNREIFRGRIISRIMFLAGGTLRRILDIVTLASVSRRHRHFFTTQHAMSV